MGSPGAGHIVRIGRTAAPLEPSRSSCCQRGSILSGAGCSRADAAEMCACSQVMTGVLSEGFNGLHAAPVAVRVVGRRLAPVRQKVVALSMASEAVSCIAAGSNASVSASSARLRSRPDGPASDRRSRSPRTGVFGEGSCISTPPSRTRAVGARPRTNGPRDDQRGPRTNPPRPWLPVYAFECPWRTG
jgi:hypothetical protein